MQGIPTDFGQYGVLVAFLCGAGIALGAVVRWRTQDLTGIANRIKNELTAQFEIQIQQLRSEVAELSGEVVALKNGQSAARDLIVEALVGTLEPTTKALLVKASAALH